MDEPLKPAAVQDTAIKPPAVKTEVANGETMLICPRTENNNEVPLVGGFVPS